MDKVLICSQCDHQMGNYHNTEIGLICDECYKEYQEELAVR